MGVGSRAAERRAAYDRRAHQFLRELEHGERPRVEVQLRPGVQALHGRELEDLVDDTCVARPAGARLNKPAAEPRGKRRSAVRAWHRHQNYMRQTSQGHVGLFSSNRRRSNGRVLFLTQERRRRCEGALDHLGVDAAEAAALEDERVESNHGVERRAELREPQAHGK